MLRFFYVRCKQTFNMPIFSQGLVLRGLLTAAAITVLVSLLVYYMRRQARRRAEGYEQQVPYFIDQEAAVETPGFDEAFTQAGAVRAEHAIEPAEARSNESYRAVDFATTTPSTGSGCFPRDQLTLDQLLPKDAANAKWSELNPAGQGDAADQNYLNAGALVGIDTVSSSLKNANMQLRSDPPIPRVGNWGIHVSTIEPDLHRRPLE